MASRNSVQRHRELRRRVLLPARLRVDSNWCDARILNISSRGLMIQVSRGAPQTSTVELRRGEHIIVARVMWRDGSRAGLRSEEQLPVEDILSLSQAPQLQLTAAGGFVERRRQPRCEHEWNRLRGRLFEFAAVAIIGGMFAVGIFNAVEQAFVAPMAIVEAALGR